MSFCREVTVLGKYKLHLRPDNEFIASLKEASVVCKSINKQKHHFWYKGLHPLADELHAASHSAQDLAKANKKLSRSSKGRFFPDAKRMDLQLNAMQAIQHELSLLEIVRIYDSKPELTIPELDDEVFSLAYNSREERRKADRLLLERHGAPKNIVSLLSARER